VTAGRPAGSRPGPARPGPAQPAREPGCRIFTGRWSTPPGPQRCAREPNLDSSIAGGLAIGATSRPVGADAGGRPPGPQTTRRICRALGEAAARRSRPVTARNRVDTQQAERLTRPGRLAPGFWAPVARIPPRWAGPPEPPAPFLPRLALCSGSEPARAALGKPEPPSWCEKAVRRRRRDPPGLHWHSRVAEAHLVSRFLLCAHSLCARAVRARAEAEAPWAVRVGPREPIGSRVLKGHGVVRAQPMARRGWGRGGICRVPPPRRLRGRSPAGLGGTRAFFSLCRLWAVRARGEKGCGVRRRGGSPGGAPVSP
jgi:hypothetical protein